jgi:hypothetical protein
MKKLKKVCKILGVPTTNPNYSDYGVFEKNALAIPYPCPIYLIAHK